MLASLKIIATIPPKVHRRVQYEYDTVSYKDRHLGENFFADLKQFRGIATRYAKLADSFIAFINLAAWLMFSRGRPRKARSAKSESEQVTRTSKVERKSRRSKKRKSDR